jgi:heme/copper-type cytochrome/quinol oxidase subunit 4
MLTHFSAALLFALFTAIVFGITQRSDPKMMLRLGVFTFAILIAAVIAGSWIMWAIKH